MVYECNRHCDCGPGCKTRVVQKGRKVPLQIFKTENRGFGEELALSRGESILTGLILGLKCLVDLQEGQFIDTYRGEIITDTEAERRELTSQGKASYLFTLDKFVGTNGLTNEDCYVVDGQYKGGVTRFMNHSCMPNCGQYTVSFNKYDIKIYQLAFFARDDIPAGTELTFDYLDADDHEESGEVGESQDGETMIECKCGSSKCRKRLWR